MPGLRESQTAQLRAEVITTTMGAQILSFSTCLMRNMLSCSFSSFALSAFTLIDAAKWLDLTLDRLPPYLQATLL